MSRSDRRPLRRRAGQTAHPTPLDPPPTPPYHRAAKEHPPWRPSRSTPAKVHEFDDAPEPSTTGLAKHHDTRDEVWIKIHKVASGLPSITPKEAIDVVLCWGWIDAVRKGLDDKSYLQRYTPRGQKSIWSQINVDNVARLIDEGRMTQHGLKAGRGRQGRRPLGQAPMAAART